MNSVVDRTNHIEYLNKVIIFSLAYMNKNGDTTIVTKKSDIEIYKNSISRLIIDTTSLLSLLNSIEKTVNSNENKIIKSLIVSPIKKKFYEESYSRYVTHYKDFLVENSNEIEEVKLYELKEKSHILEEEITVNINNKSFSLLDDSE